MSVCGCKPTTMQFITWVCYTCITTFFYLCQGGYVFVVVCLSVCLLATFRKNFRTDLHEIFKEGWQRADEQMIKCWWRSISPSGYRDCFPDSSLLGDTINILVTYGALQVFILYEPQSRFARLWLDSQHDNLPKGIRTIRMCKLYSNDALVTANGLASIVKENV